MTFIACWGRRDKGARLYTIIRLKNFSSHETVDQFSEIIKSTTVKTAAKCMVRIWQTCDERYIIIIILIIIMHFICSALFIQRNLRVPITQETRLVLCLFC